MRSEFKCEIYKSEVINEEYRKYLHPSGLEIYIFPKEMSTAYAIFGAKYGSVHNKFISDGEVVSVPDGVAHFLEHKLFSNEDGTDSFVRFSKFGAEANAYTSFNRTAYLFNCTENFEQAFAELLEFVTHPYFTEESVNAEKGIIAEEIKMYDDSPYDRCYYGMLEGLYKDHSIKRNICGSVESISKITPEMLYRCYNDFYSLSNMLLILCGDINEDNVFDIIDQKLSLERRALKEIKINENEFESPKVNKPYVEQKMQVSKPLFNIAFKDTDIPQNAHERQKKDAVMAILDEMLFSRAGELYNYLFENDIISPNLSCGYTISETFAYNSIVGEAEDPQLVLKEIKKHIKKTISKGLSKEDFECFKRVMYAEFVRSFDSTDSIANNLFSFASEGAELLSYADIISSVTLEDVEEMLKTSFTDERTTLSVILPI